MLAENITNLTNDASQWYVVTFQCVVQVIYLFFSLPLVFLYFIIIHVRALHMRCPVMFITCFILWGSDLVLIINKQHNNLKIENFFLVLVLYIAQAVRPHTQSSLLTYAATNGKVWNQLTTAYLCIQMGSMRLVDTYQMKNRGNCQHLILSFVCMLRE